MMRIVAAVLAGLLAACSGATATAPMESAAAAWEERGVDSYEMRLTYDCFCPGAGTWDVTVVDGGVTSADAVDVTGPDSGGADVPTVDRLLSWASSTVSQFEDVEVTVDVQEGVPMAGSVDAPRAVDEELSWEILAFTAKDDLTSLAVPGHLPSTLTRRR